MRNASISVHPHGINEEKLGGGWKAVEESFDKFSSDVVAILYDV